MLQQITTPFGVIYIDPWNARQRDEKERIKIYDSRQKYLDYFALDYFYDDWDGDPDSLYIEAHAAAQYAALCDMLQRGGEEETCEDFMDWLGILSLYVGSDRQAAITALYADRKQYCQYQPTEEDLRTFDDNEWVNRIGDNYIVICE